jgi:hypothetical protein
MVSRELEGFSVKLKNARFGPFFVGVMVIRGILFI